MYLRRTLLFVLFSTVAGASSVTVAGVADDCFQRGEALLEKGDLPAALNAYADAVRADRSSQAYLQEYMLVRRAIALDQALANEKAPERWLQIAEALRSFYAQKNLHAKALEIDEQIHKTQGTESSALQLAETQMTMHKYVDAERVLLSLGPDKSKAAQALLAVALAHQERLAEAREIAEAVSTPIFCDVGTLYSIARMRAVVGDTNECLAVLTRCFEATPPSNLDRFKAHAEQSADFVAMASTPGFRAVLRTNSKIAESKCSGGETCAGCPMRGKCPSAGSK